MTESILQADLQRELRRLTSVFGSDDVVICDWSVLDGSSQNAPFVIIDVADTFDIDGILGTYSEVWQLPFDLVVRFTDWDTARAALRDARESVITHLRKTENYNNASGLLAWGLRKISSGSGIEDIYDKYNENPIESLPVYLSQTIILEVEETAGA